ncbi:MAG TPA: diaminopimelate epimerase [Bacteroidia bacterium]|nr:diaminopimelate epimerase [Bacteroidia bacterium]
MLLQFYKYQGTGNDFIMIDNRHHNLQLQPEQIQDLCSRRFGIGADGLILLELEPGVDFKMVYFNSDGRPSSMCGNGGRCITAFAHHLGLIREKTKFLAIDGLHEAEILDNAQVALKMCDVKSIEKNDDLYFLNTGSPHVVKFVTNVREYPVLEEARKIRYSPRFSEEGTNVNFIERSDDGLFVRTYERGVEDETYSCGTGVTASALVAALEGVSDNRNACRILTLGGGLEVKFEKVLEQNFYNIWLIGPAEYVFRGEMQHQSDK